MEGKKVLNSRAREGGRAGWADGREVDTISNIE